MHVLTRSYDSARTGANTQETILTAGLVGNNLLVKKFSLEFNDDPRLEAQPLYVPGIKMDDGKVHDVVYVCTMANNVWAFDANDGKPIWNKPANLGPAVQPKPAPHPGFPHATEIDIWGINRLWGILSTPVIDLEANELYVVNWTSPDKSIDQAVFKLNALKLIDGAIRKSVVIAASADSQGKPNVKFAAPHQKQRAALLLTKVQTNPGGATMRTLFAGFGMTREDREINHGWLIAFDPADLRTTAAWCTTPNGIGSGIWQAGQGPACDEHGDIYVLTGNYGTDLQGHLSPPAPGDFPQCFVKLHYTPPANPGAPGKLEAVGWFMPFRDIDRPNTDGQPGGDDFQDYDLGSAGPVPIPGMSLVVGAGKDGVVYVLDKNTAAFGKGSNYSVLKQPPIFFTYFPGFGIDASKVANLNHLFDGKTHHLHGSPAAWTDPARGQILFDWGENECLRAWTIDAAGKITFVAKSAEVASAGMGGKGGMPGGLLAVTSNGQTPHTGIVWALAPVSNDANRFVVEGILRAYDASALDPVSNIDRTPRLKLLWDSKHIPGNTFHHCKFCPPVIADGKIFVPTYDGRVDVYGLLSPHPGPLPTNANRVPEPD